MEATVDYSSICVITSITQRLMVVSFRKPTRLSLPLRKAPPFSPSLQGREDVTALRCSEPLRSKVGGPSKVFDISCGMGPPGNVGVFMKIIGAANKKKSPKEINP